MCSIQHIFGCYLWLVVTSSAVAEPPTLQIRLSGAGTCLAWSTRGDLLAVGSQNGDIQIFESATGKASQLLKMDAAIKTMAWAQDGKKLAAIDDRHEVCLWDLTKPDTERVVVYFAAKMEVVAFVNDGKGLGMLGQHSVIQFTQRPFADGPADGAMVFTMNEQSIQTANRPRAYTLAPDFSAGGWLEDDQSIAFFGSGKGIALTRRQVPTKHAKLNYFACGPNSIIAVAGESSKTIEIWDPMQNGNPLNASSFPRPLQIDCPVGIPGGLTFSGDGNSLAVVSSQGLAIHRWKLGNRPNQQRLYWTRGLSGPVALSPDGAKIVMAVKGQDVALVWNSTLPRVVSGVGGAELPAPELARLWRDLGSSDTGLAKQAWDKFLKAKCPIAFLSGKVTEVSPKVSLTVIEQQVARLGADKFAVRDKTQADLAAWGELAIAPLERELEKKPSLELSLRARRLLEKLAEQPPTPDQFLALEAVELLERCGSPAAAEALEQIARETLVPSIRRQARGALERLARGRK
jgi:hypothetical protein